MVKKIYTRFRAYQLGNAGSSFSYYANDHFTLIEARLTEVNKKTLSDELKIVNKKTIDTLHITSWDQDHCSFSQLEEILEKYKPKKIEYPGYKPHTETGIKSLAVIKEYKKSIRTEIKIQSITPKYIDSLDRASNYGYTDIIYGPKKLVQNANDNSTIKHFRRGSFNVLSLGDVENHMISAALSHKSTIQKEVDVMILAHHGADNGFTTSNFLKKSKPQVAIATSNYDNQFSHPKNEIRDLLYKNEITLFTTKTGDIIIESVGDNNGKYEVTNLISGSQEVSSTKCFTSKKKKQLNVNSDTLRARKNKRSYPK